MQETQEVPLETMGGGIDTGEYKIGRPKKTKEQKFRKISTTLAPKIHAKCLQLRLRWSDLISAGLFHSEHCNEVYEKMLESEANLHTEIEKLRNALEQRNKAISSESRIESE